MAEMEMVKDCPRREDNLVNCPCDNVECAHRGICCECIAHHREKGNRPACMK